MAGFLYYRPGAGLVQLPQVAALGLAHAFDGGSPAGSMCTCGPDGGSGVVFADHGRLGKKAPCLQMDRQTWRKMPRDSESTPVWVGWYKDSPPVPADLLRPAQIAGPMMELADGNRWQIPLVRRFDEAVGQFAGALPRIADIDEDGQWIFGELPSRHRPLWDSVGRFVDKLCDTISDGDGGTAEYTMADELDAIVNLLGANYVVSKVEVAALGLLTGDGMVLDILMAAADWHTFTDWASKKNEKVDSTPSTEDGQPVA